MKIVNISSVYYKDFGDIILVKQGIWNKLEIELSEEEFENNNSNWIEFKKSFIEIMNGNSYEIDECDKYIKSVYQELLSYELVSIYNSNIYSYIDIDNFLLKENNEWWNKFTTYVIIADESNIRLIRKINKFCIKNNIKWILGIAQTNFITIINFSYQNKGCFNCFEDGLLSRLIDNYSIAEEELNINYNISKNNVFQFEKDFIKSTIELCKTKFNTNSIISIYLPTFSLKKEILLKNPNCDICSKSKINNKNQEVGYSINYFQDGINDFR